MGNLANPSNNNGMVERNNGLAMKSKVMENQGINLASGLSYWAKALLESKSFAAQ